MKYLYCIIAVIIYRAMESLDGEKGLKVLEYKQAEKIKIECLKFIK